MTRATIEESGHGFPDAGHYCAGEGRLWRVVSIDSRIRTGAVLGRSNWVHATVEPVSWHECSEAEEFPANVVTADDEDDR